MGTSALSLHVIFLMQVHVLFPREQREKEEIEKYRMERPKIQQQFSDLKVSRWASITGFQAFT
jgi:hypothetical protein